MSKECKDNILLTGDMLTTLSYLPADVCLSVMQAIRGYVKGEEVELSNELAKGIFQGFKERFDKVKIKYEEKCKQNAENGKRGGLASGKARSESKRNEANASNPEAKRSESNHNDNDNDIIKKEKIKKEKAFLESAERIWQFYPKKDGKKKGIEAIINALKRGKSEEYLIDRVNLYAESRQVRDGYSMNAQGWFNQERYNDESLDNPQPNGNQISIEQVKAEYEQVYYEDLHADISEYRAERQAFLNADERTILTKYRDEYESMCRRIRNRQR